MEFADFQRTLEFIFYTLDYILHTLFAGAFFWSIIAILGKRKHWIARLETGFSQVIQLSAFAFSSLVLISIVYYLTTGQMGYAGHSGYLSNNFLFHWGVLTLIVGGSLLMKHKALKNSKIYHLLYSFAVFILTYVVKLIIELSSFHRDYLETNYAWEGLGLAFLIVKSTLLFMVALWIVSLTKKTDQNPDILDE